MLESCGVYSRRFKSRRWQYKNYKHAANSAVHPSEVGKRPMEYSLLVSDGGGGQTFLVCQKLFSIPLGTLFGA